MKRMILGMSVVAAMLLTASSAMAAGVNLTWNACLADGGASNKATACTSNAGSNLLVGTFQLDADQLGVTGVEIVIDLIAQGGTLPAWWQFNSLNIGGQCRTNSLTGNATLDVNAINCVDWAQGAAAGGIARYDGAGSVAPADTAAHKRLKMGFAVATPVDVVSAQEYFAFNMIVNNAKSVGTGLCAGCSTPVCIVLNSINVVPGVLAGIFLGQGTTPGSNLATWQGTGANCSAVPVKNATWGQVKALYR